MTKKEEIDYERLPIVDTTVNTAFTLDSIEFSANRLFLENGPI